MPWTTQAPCEKCGSQLALYTDQEELPTTTDRWTTHCNKCNKARLIAGLAVWDEVSAPPREALLLQPYPKPK